MSLIPPGRTLQSVWLSNWPEQKDSYRSRRLTGMQVDCRALRRCDPPRLCVLIALLRCLGQEPLHLRNEGDRVARLSNVTLCMRPCDESFQFLFALRGLQHDRYSTNRVEG